MDAEEEGDPFLRWIAENCETDQEKLKREYRRWRDEGVIRVYIKGWGQVRRNAYVHYKLTD